VISALITGDLVADPVERTAKNGSSFTTCNMRVPAGADALFIGVAAFNETDRERLRKLGKGSSLAAVGSLEQAIWTDREGQERISWRLTASEVLSVYQANKRRAPTSDGHGEPPE
jgi:single-stranded DNA-binding protein